MNPLGSSRGRVAVAPGLLNHCCVQLSGSRGTYQSVDGQQWSAVDLDYAVIQAAVTDGETVVLGGFRGRGAEGVLWVSY